MLVTFVVMNLFQALIVQSQLESLIPTLSFPSTNASSPVLFTLHVPKETREVFSITPKESMLLLTKQFLTSITLMALLVLFRRRGSSRALLRDVWSWIVCPKTPEWKTLFFGSPSQMVAFTVAMWMLSLLANVLSRKDDPYLWIQCMHLLVFILLSVATNLALSFVLYRPSIQKDGFWTTGLDPRFVEWLQNKWLQRSGLTLLSLISPLWYSALHMPLQFLWRQLPWATQIGLQYPMFTAGAFMCFCSLLTVVLAAVIAHRHMLDMIVPVIVLSEEVRERSGICFKSAVMPKPSRSQDRVFLSRCGNTHSVEASNRASFITFSSSFSQLLGRDRWFFRMSMRLRKQLSGNEGGDDWNDSRYAQEMTRELDICSDLAVVIDRDWEMSEFPPCPTLLYSFQPEDPAGLYDATQFWPISKDELFVQCVGSSSIRQTVWDFSEEYFDQETAVPGTFLRFQVHKRYMSLHRLAVLLIPLLYVTSETHSLKPARRRRFMEEGRPAVSVFNQEGESYISVAAVSSNESYRIPRSIFCALQAAHRQHAGGLGTATVLEQMGWKAPADQGKAIVVREFIRCTTEAPEPVIIPREFAVLDFQWLNYEPEAKVPMKAFMTPILNEGFVAARSLGNDKTTIEHRVGKFQRKAEVTKMPPSRFFKYAQDFIEATAPETLLQPCDSEVVRANQARPQQRRLIEEAEFFHGENITVKCFQKAEAYGKPSHPRNISQDPTRIKIAAARFAYPLMDHIASMPWYAFCKPPRKVARRIAKICRKVDKVVKTDYSRWDGHLTAFLRQVFAMYVKRCFGQSEELDEVLSTRILRECLTQFRVRFNSGYSQLSGDMFTSTSNTFLNAFVAYCTYREMGMDHSLAMEKVEEECVFGGDDGHVTCDIAAMSKTCETLGLEIKAEECTRSNNVPVVFLSRHFSPEVWSGRVDSACDLTRQLAKLHLTTNCDPNVDVRQKAVEKALSYSCTDINTPIIGDWCQAVLDLWREDFVRPDHQHMSYFSHYQGDENWPNDMSGWEDVYLNCYSMLEYAVDFVIPRDPLSCPLIVDRPRPSRPKEGGELFVQGEPVPELVDDLVAQQSDLKAEKREEPESSSLEPSDPVPVPGERLGQKKMIEINKFVAAHVGKLPVCYVGSFGYESTTDLLDRCPKTRFHLWDPCYKSKEEGPKMKSDLKDKYKKRVTVYDRCFGLRQAKEAKGLQVGDTFFFDDSHPRLASARGEHFKHVVTWLEKFEPPKALLKLPVGFLEGGIKSIKGYEGLLMHDPVVEGFERSELRLFLTKKEGSVYIFPDDLQGSAQDWVIPKTAHKAEAHKHGRGDRKSVV